MPCALVRTNLAAESDSEASVVCNYINEVYVTSVPAIGHGVFQDCAGAASRSSGTSCLFGVSQPPTQFSTLDQLVMSAKIEVRETQD